MRCGQRAFPSSSGLLSQGRRVAGATDLSTRAIGVIAPPLLASASPFLLHRGDALRSTAGGSASKEEVSSSPSPRTHPLAATLSPEEQAAFLTRFRARLAQADSTTANLETFIPTSGATQEGGATQEPSTTLPPLSAYSTPAAAIKRGVDPLPKWLKLQIPKGHSSHPKYLQIKRSMRERKLSTVCEEAKCPNIGECWGGGGKEGEDGGGAATATIMLMGSECTRGCRFCSVKTSRQPKPLDPEEPLNTAQAVHEMGVDYIVVTMVDRDDLADGGVQHVARTIQLIKEHTPTMLVETLVGDWQGKLPHVEIIARSGVDTYAHNVECVERITPNVRDRRASYRQSLTTLEHAKKVSPSILTKSSIMLGLGEELPEVLQTLKDLRHAGVDCLTLGQYLQPSSTRLKVSRYVHPDEFKMWEAEANQLGFLYCASGPMVRSSYRAGEFYLRNIIKHKQQQQQASNLQSQLANSAIHAPPTHE